MQNIAIFLFIKEQYKLSSPKIVITIPWFYPAYKAGGPIQSVVNLVENCKDFLPFFIYTGNKDLGGELLKGTKENTWTLYNRNTQVFYASGKTRFGVRALRIEPAIVFIVGVFSWRFNIVPLYFWRAKKKILSVRGMLHPGALMQKPFKKKIFIQFLKFTGIDKRIIFHATDDEERKIICSIFGNDVQVVVVNNFPTLFTPKKNVRKRKRLSLLTVALFSPMKNFLLVLNALKNCSFPIDYTIYGPIKDIEYWHKCQMVISTMPPNISIYYGGAIEPKQLGHVLNEHDLFIMPSKSENFGHSLIEALSAGLPVITSHFTPWNDLEAGKAGINVKTDEQSIKSAIEKFAIMDDIDFSSWSYGAAAYARKMINFEETCSKYIGMFQL